MGVMERTGPGSGSESIFSNVFLKVSVIASEDTGIYSSRCALPVFFLNTKFPVISLKCPLTVTCIMSH